jgi:hypothetical protein
MIKKTLCRKRGTILNARNAVLCLLALALAAGAAGCGGDDDGDLTTSSLSKAAYAKKVNDVCDKSVDAMLAAMLSFGEENAAATERQTAIRAIQAKVPAALRSQQEKVRALGAPSGDEEKVEAYLASLDRAIQAVEDRKPADLFELAATLKPVNKAAAAYGLEDCEY